MKLIPSLVMLFAISFSGIPLAADVGSLAWNRANIETLRSVDKQTIATFLNEQRRTEGQPPGIPLEPLTARDVGGFGWADPLGNGHYQLLVSSSGPCAGAVTIYNRDDSGRVAVAQVIPHFANLKTGIRDLDGDGKDELIVGEPLVEHSCATVIAWPAVYRLGNGKYVEASRDFPGFYDREILPQLETRIRKYHGRGSDLTEDVGASLIMERDKILRVLGRDPSAGLNQAYQWMNSDDPYLALDAEATFKDIGGHENDARGAEASYKRDLCTRHPGLVMCRDLSRR